MRTTGNSRARPRNFYLHVSPLAELGGCVRRVVCGDGRGALRASRGRALASRRNAPLRGFGHPRRACRRLAAGVAGMASGPPHGGPPIGGDSGRWPRADRLGDPDDLRGTGSCCAADALRRSARTARHPSRRRHDRDRRVPTTSGAAAAGSRAPPASRRRLTSGSVRRPARGRATAEPRRSARFRSWVVATATRRTEVRARPGRGAAPDPRRGACVDGSAS